MEMLKRLLLNSALLCIAATFAHATVTPQRFGAVADGKHDDTEAIQSALDLRGKVFLPAGTYRISGKLVIHSGTQLLGEEGTRVSQTKDSFILYNEHAQVKDAEWDENITIRNIAFDGTQVNAKSEYTAGLYMCGVRNLIIENCTLKDIGGDGIYLGRGGRDRYCETVRINKCVFDNCGHNAANPRQSIAVVFGENVKITKCTMYNTRKSSAAVDVEPNKADEHCSVTVSNCRMVGCGISSGGNKSAQRKLIVTRCFIDCSETVNAPLAVSGTDARITNTTIISNEKQNGINIVSSPSAVVKNNSIRNGAAGVLVTDGADNVVVKGNVIESCSSGVYLIRSKAVTIESNTLKVRGKGVYVRMECDGTRIERNSIQSEAGLSVYSIEKSYILARRNKEL